MKCPPGTAQCKNGKAIACSPGWYLGQSGVCKQARQGGESDCVGGPGRRTVLLMQRSNGVLSVLQHAPALA